MGTESTQNSRNELGSLRSAKMTRSFCYMCPFHCITETYVKDGKIVYVKGVEEAPNRGRCVRGMASVQFTQDPDRLKRPLKRTGPRGSGQFTPISWDEALDLVAGKLLEIKEKWGPETVLLEYGRSPLMPFMQTLLTQGYGTPNVYGHTAICEQDRRCATLNLFGHVYPVRDYENSRYIMLWGFNPLGSPQMLFENRGIISALGAGSKLVVVDPSLSSTARRATEWIPLRPGSDGALGLAMCRVIVDENLYDREFVTKWCHGFDDFAGHLRGKGYDPQWASEITGLDRERIVRLAREFASTKPALAECFKGLGNYENGIDATRTVYVLNALTGNVDGPGNIILKEFSSLGPAVQLPEEKRAKIQREPLHVAMGYPLAPDLPAGQVPQAVLEGIPYPVKGWIFYHRNKMMTDADTSLQRKALREVHFSLAIDIYLSETALECDVVLPDCCFYERAELKDNLWLGPQIVLGQPVVEPPGECRPLDQVAQGLAKRMGLGEYFDFQRWEDWAKKMLEPTGLDLAYLKENAYWNGELRYRKYLQKGFATPTGKVEIWSTNFERCGYNPLPEYKEPLVRPAKDYPLYMIHQKSSVHKQSKTQNLPLLMEIEGENRAQINPVDADPLGIRDGDFMVITSELGSAKIRAEVTEGIRPGTVCVIHGHGFGHWALGELAKGKGAHINPILPTRVNSVSGGTGFNECSVRVTRA